MQVFWLRQLIDILNDEDQGDKRFKEWSYNIKINPYELCHLGVSSMGLYTSRVMAQIDLEPRYGIFIVYDKEFGERIEPILKTLKPNMIVELQ